MLTLELPTTIEEIVDLERHIWITARKVRIPVRQMSTSHIYNCINCLKGNGRLAIPRGYLGGKKKWLEIFNQELINRQ